MIPIKPFRQKAGYCGAASLKMVLDYYGIDITERKLARLSGSSRSKGVPAKNLIKAAKKLGLTGFYKDYSSLRDIIRYVSKGIPVIVDWFSEIDGHYSVVTGIDKENIYLQDPQLGHLRALKLKTFKKIWFDFAQPMLRTKNDIIIRRMIVIKRE